METPKIEISDTLQVLLRLWKRDSDPDMTVENVQTALQPLYHPKMGKLDILRVVLNAYLELLDEPRFQAGSNRKEVIIAKLLTTPIRNLRQGMNYFKPIDYDEVLRVGDIIDSQILEMMSDIRLSNIGWCRHVLWPEEGVTNAST